MNILRGGNPTKKMIDPEFIRVHRSYIVNMAHIQKITNNTIVLSNQMTTPIGRSYLKDVVAQFSEYSTRLEGGIL